MCVCVRVCFGSGVSAFMMTYFVVRQCVNYPVRHRYTSVVWLWSIAANFHIQMVLLIDDGTLQ